tara:strand:- start:743 stop:1516 length:774 start_codon:yes stop_codon:yes gene_type:complete
MFSSNIVSKEFNNKRLDLFLVGMGIVKSRQRAVSLIMSGNVYISHEKIDKPGKLIKNKQIIRIKKNDNPWVSRGGLKLAKAISNFKINVKDKICADVGCSTGGFSDVLLKKGAKRIFAIDVGYGQFDWRLRNSKNIILLERTNAKFLNSKVIKELLDLVVCDVSFISLKKVILPFKNLLKQKFEIVALIKPQFEVSKQLVGKKGIIRDEKIHSNICKNINAWFVENFSPDFVEIIDSPILGQKGNKEFLIYVKKVSD